MKKILFILLLFSAQSYGQPTKIKFDGATIIFKNPVTGQLISIAPAAGGAMTNPMTTTGDIIYSSDNSGTPARLAAGTSGYVLTANGAGAAASWQAPAVSASNTVTFTNKRWTARVGSTTSSGTPTINTDNYDVYKLTAQAADITSFTTNLSGTPADGDILEVQITGTAARAITWGSSFVSTTVTLPTTTVSTTTLTVILQYYTTSSYGNNKWHCVNYY